MKRLMLRCLVCKTACTTLPGWNDKGRQGLINWLLLSRNQHWDLLLLVQDAEMVDNQIKTTLCDYLVQASRTDRQKIPYFAPLMEFLGFSAFFPKFHIYEGYYGFIFTDKPQFVRRFRGVDLYDGYDTNQLFTDGQEIIEFKSGLYAQAKIVDMRATFTYLPAAYLTRQIYIGRLQKQIDVLTAPPSEENDMATKRKNFGNQAADKMKIYGVLAIVAAYFVYRFVFNAAPGLPVAHAAPVPVVMPAAPVSASAAPSSAFVDSARQTWQAQAGIISPDSQKSVTPAKEDFLSRLIAQYRPRLAAELSSAEKYDGIIEFYDGDKRVERLTFKELRGFRVSIIPRPYGVDLVSDVGTFSVTRWDNAPSSGQKQQGKA
jgi:hypothetical protein